MNAITYKEPYPIPRIDEILSLLSGANYFTCLDATSGYHQIQVEQTDTQKTAFTWKRKQYVFNRMPFGLCNAPSTFQRAMDIIFKEEPNVICYLDDIIIKSDSLHEHKILVDRVMLKLKAAGITLNREKCKFFAKKIKLLGFVVENGKIHTDPEKSKIIKEFKKPSNVSELRSFLGLCNFNRNFIANYSTKTHLLYDNIAGHKKRSKQKILWTTESNEQ